MCDQKVSARVVINTVEVSVLPFLHSVITPSVAKVNWPEKLKIG